MTEILKEWIDDNVRLFSSKSELVKSCCDNLNLSKSYVYKTLRKDSDFSVIVDLWKIIEDLDGSLVKEKELIKEELKVSTKRWTRIKRRFKIDNVRIHIEKGNMRGTYIGQEDVIKELTKFMRNQV